MGSALALAACEKSSTRTREEADKAQVEAEKNVRQAQKNAEEAKTEARVATAKERADLREKIQKEIATLDARVEKNRADLPKKSGKELERLHNDTTFANTRADTLRKDLQQIDAVSDTDWPTFKSRIEDFLSQPSRS
jgi:hypothetical protein